MSRIRSIHPGQWTDEDFVSLSMAARLLALGLRNEADDNGVFEWRPTRLKMRLFPADAIDVATLLDELTTNSIVMRYEFDGRPYGVIRNFRVYQNPRSPKAEHPVTPEADAFAGVREGDGAVEKKAPGRPRKPQAAEKATAEPKSFLQSAEKNSERRGEESSYISPSDSSIGEPTDASPPVPDEPPSRQLLVVDNVGPAFDEYQACRAEFVPNAKPLQLTPKRRRNLAARLREIDGLPGWAGMLDQIRGSPFLRGERSRSGFVAEIDWVLKPENFRKILEGNYDERPRAGSTGGSAVTGAVDAMRAARAALGVG